MIKIRNLTKYYGDLCAVDDVSFDIKKGEILALLGPNGAGKTTIYRILTGYLKPTSGNIEVMDYNIYEHMMKIKNKIGYLPEAAPIYRDMLVFDYLDFVADIRGISTEKKMKQIRELSELCGLDEVIHMTIDELSKGYKQRVGIAHALMGDPDILVLDEPTVGLDPNQIVETRDIIKRIGKTKTIIYSTHILSEAEATCDRIVVINRGKKVADDTLKGLQDAMNEKSFENIFMKLTRGN
ncbi:MAG: ATP-binding cassette domain-containing protein [Candidatus Aminicenantes bacterium]|nr:ATP-binding cassette domain-containing protein [Candidatus Aminicenantes bacterium]